MAATTPRKRKLHNRKPTLVTVVVLVLRAMLLLTLPMAATTPRERKLHNRKPTLVTAVALVLRAMLLLTLPMAAATLHKRKLHNRKPTLVTTVALVLRVVLLPTLPTAAATLHKQKLHNRKPTLVTTVALVLRVMLLPVLLVNKTVHQVAMSAMVMPQILGVILTGHIILVLSIRVPRMRMVIPQEQVIAEVQLHIKGMNLIQVVIVPQAVLLPVLIPQNQEPKQESLSDLSNTGKIVHQGSLVNLLQISLLLTHLLQPTRLRQEPTQPE